MVTDAWVDHAIDARRAPRTGRIDGREETMLDSLRQDLRFAMRSLRRSPGFAAVAVLTLALGIGANTAIFSVVNGVLLQPLALARPEQLLALGEGRVGGAPTDLGGTSPASFLDWRREAAPVAAMAAWDEGQLTLTGMGEPETLDGVNTVGDFFGVLGVAPLVGRATTEADELAEAPVVVLSYAAWQRLFGGDPGAVGRSIVLEGTARTVVGVMPPDFRFPSAGASYWKPARLSPEMRANRDQYYLSVVARLAAGVSIERAQGVLETVASRLRREWPQYNTDLRINAVPLKETIVGDVRARLAILMGAVSLVLLIACANLGNLMLARSVTRRREVAVRQALGAGRRRIVMQLLTESLVLALAGGAAGLLVGAGLLRVLLAQRSVVLPRAEEVGLDGTVLAFTLGIATLAGIAFGIVPALRLSHARSSDALREGTRGSAGHAWARSALVVSELALAMVLLAGAGLLLHSFALLTRVDPGLRTERLLTFDVSLRGRDPDFVPRSLERLRALPGVRAASVTSFLPVSGRGVGAWFNIIDRPLPPDRTPPGEAYRVVTPDYFTTAGVPLLRGRALTDDDRAGRQSSVVINDALARKYWPGESPLGKEIYLGAPDNRIVDHATIVGVVGDTRDAGLGADPLPIVYIPLGLVPKWPFFSYMIRTTGEPEAIARAARDVMRSLDPSLAIRNVRSMDDRVRESVAPARWSMALLTLFAGVALAMAAVGVFGVLSFLVTQRTRELGIRMALGAAPGEVRRMVVAHAARLAIIGAALGLAGALVLGRVMEGLLYGISSTDPATYAAVTAVLLAIAVLASWLPARRATRVDPMVALRSE
jgi:predicted permease